MKHCVLSVVLLTAYAISLKIQKMDNDEDFNVKNCKSIGANTEGNICICSSDNSTLTSHPGETYYCKEIEEREENCNYLLF